MPLTRAGCSVRQHASSQTADYATSPRWQSIFWTLSYPACVVDESIEIGVEVGRNAMVRSNRARGTESPELRLGFLKCNFS